MKSLLASCWWRFFIYFGFRIFKWRHELGFFSLVKFLANCKHFTSLQFTLFSFSFFPTYFSRFHSLSFFPFLPFSHILFLFLCFFPLLVFLIDCWRRNLQKKELLQQRFFTKSNNTTKHFTFEKTTTAKIKAHSCFMV